MIAALLPWIADMLIVFGLVVITIGVIGLVRLPNLYTRIHAGSSAVFLGVIAVLLAGLATGDFAFSTRIILISAFLVLTGPVSAHAIGRAAFLRHERMTVPDVIDESGEHLIKTESERR